MGRHDILRLGESPASHASSRFLKHDRDDVYLGIYFATVRK